MRSLRRPLLTKAKMSAPFPMVSPSAWSRSVSTSSCSRCPQTLFQKPVDIETTRTRGCVLFL
ncbi:hypothetical protein HMPREF0372_00194 [Flavonifractor plautii ATCC 29863]|uniref:Uncharacterized protein n=1 Tax=Flavonifractor plautii ATCC 29863 TaxID=411475 RepID=G9YL31_FLAPL|nr:hypothetical protein HMPREF0372_00194 [Flavonifractor plautii ATCC 29863]